MGGILSTNQQAKELNLEVAIFSPSSFNFLESSNRTMMEKKHNQKENKQTVKWVILGSDKAWISTAEIIKSN